MKTKSIQEVAQAVIDALNHTAMDDVISGRDRVPVVIENRASFTMTGAHRPRGGASQWKVTIEEVK